MKYKISLLKIMKKIRNMPKVLRKRRRFRKRSVSVKLPAKRKIFLNIRSR